jgi:hypothetical protein
VITASPLRDTARGRGIGGHSRAAAPVQRSAVSCPAPEDAEAEWAGAPANGGTVLLIDAASLVEQVPLVQLGHQVNRAGGPKAHSFHCRLLSSDLSVRLVVEAWPAVCAGCAPRKREPDEPHHHCQQLHRRRSFA